MDDGRFRLDDFELYQIGRAFRKRVYGLVRMLPPEEKFCLANQMRRAALSVSNNIAEGHGRWHYQENIRYCRMSRGSVDELIDDLKTCEDERYVNRELIVGLKTEAYDLIRRINGYIAYLRKSQQGGDDK